MRIFLSFIFLLFGSAIYAQNPAGSTVAAKASGSKFQFVNRQTGIPVNNLLWDETDAFVHGFARVYLNNSFSFVNSAGKLIAPAEFEDARNFSNKLAAVQKNGKWGFIDETGKLIIPFSYHIVFDFELPSVTAAFDGKKWWLINSKGVVIKPLDISVCYGFKNGVARITKEDKEGILYPDGKIIFTLAETVEKKQVPYHPNSNNIVAPCPDNIGFEFGDFTNWQCYAGDVDSVGTTNVITVLPSPPIPNRHTVYPRAIPSAIDAFGLFPLNPPDGSNFAVKLGNNVNGAEAERISYTIHVPLNDSNFSIKYDYAVVFQDPGHTIWTQPRFISRLIDSATNTAIACASFEYISSSGLPGFQISPVNSAVIFKDWASVFYSLRGYGGKTLYLEFTTADCVRRGHWGYAYVDVQSTCGSPIEVHYDCTPPNATTLTAPPGFQFYNWWDSNFVNLLGTGQVLNLNPGPAINTIIWLEMIPFSSFGCLDTLLVNINGDFDAVFDMSAASGCAPQTFTFYNRNLPSLTTLWDFGDGTTGTGDTVTHTYSLPGTYNVTLNVTVPGGCNGSALHLITIYPSPNVVRPPEQNLCNGSTTNAVSFTGSLANTVFSWTNDNPAIGLPASGTGNIAPFLAINTGSIAVTANITVTPTHLTCNGTPETFSIIVYPSPNVAQPANQILCNNETINAIPFAGTVSGTVFYWTNNNPLIGLPASGNGDIPAFTAVNTGITPVMATITVTPATGICSGIPRTFTITVKPTPNVVQPANISVCNTWPVGAINFSGNVSGTGFSWTNDNTSIGLAASGNGNIAPFTAINTGNVAANAIVTVTPTANGCPGSPLFFTINVYPTPNVVQPVNQTLCNNTATNDINFTGSVSGTSFGWTNNNPSIGLAANGYGDIPSFTAVNFTNAPVTATITVLPTVFGCPGTPQSFSITVNPTPDVVQPPNQVLCNAATTNAINFSGAVGGTLFSWSNDNTSIGLAANGTGDIPSFTAVNVTNAPVTATITVTSSANGCTGIVKSFTITVNPTPDVVQPPDQTLCNGAATNSINFSGAISGTVYNWTNNNTSIGLAATGTGDIPSFTAINNGNTAATATITVLPTIYGCTGAAQSFTITVNPTPDVVQPPNQVLCNAATTNAINFSGAVGGTLFSWSNDNTSIGLAANGTGDIPSFNAVNVTNAPVIVIITVTPSANGCTGSVRSFTITVNPTPDVVQPPDQTLCNGSATNSVNFTGAVGGTAFNWTNNNTSIGLAATGTGDIPSFTAINISNAPATATITVTPSANGCPGVPRSFTITVNPTPDVVQPVDQILCNGAATNAVHYTGAVSGTLFSWSNNNTSIGLAANGTGDIPSFTAINVTNSPVTATITVTPSANNCTGTVKSFTITVNPTPDVLQQPNQILCNGTATSSINFTGAVSGTAYNWTNNNTSIGLAATGIGDISSFTAINISNTPVTATITVTPSANGCAGIPKSFTITVNPTPDVIQPADQVLCNGATTNAISLTGAVSGTAFNWTNTNTSIGLAANGIGDISSFTAVNLTNAPITATITVTPAANSCTGPVQSFTITVNPTPDVVQPADQTLCNGVTTNAVNFTGAVSGTGFNWTNDNTSIGLAASGSGDIPAFTASNVTNDPVTATITVTPSANGCPGVAQRFIITVNPTPNVVQPTDQKICEGSATNAILFSGTVSGTSYNWTNSDPSIGLSSSGTGNIPSFRAVNPDSLPVISTITVIPSARGCNGIPKITTIRVDPNPKVNLGPDLTLSTGTVINLNAAIQNGPIANWAWIPGTGLSCTNCPSPVLNVTNDVSYNVTVSNIYGCVARDNISIFTFCKNSQVFVPNAFTPDGDGLNDVLMVRGKGIFVKTFRIFNRWGQLVFEKTNFNPNDKQYGWDGRVRGIMATPDVFVYTAEVICDNGIMYTYKGNTTLLK
ncbi:MAG: PKD-like domain-containing protein [Ferruginibacter sp.]